MGVMAGTVKMLDVGGVEAGKPQLWRLKTTTWEAQNFAVRCSIEAK
jgi:hypothetical protein